MVVTNSATTVSDITFTDRAILNWGTTSGTVAAPVTINGATITDGTSLTNFNIAGGETYNFASSGAVLNKVVAGSNTTHANLNGLGASAAIINGNIAGSAARVFVLANGNITVGNGAQIRTQSLTLSTLTESNDAIFQALGDLTAPTSASPTSTGTISLGSGLGAGLTISGNLTAAAGSITSVSGTAAGSPVNGDLVLRSITAGAGINLAGTTSLDVNGNLSVTTNGGAITQTNAVTVGASTSTVNQTAAFNSGTAATTLANNSNNFEVLTAQTSGTLGHVTVRDANIITLGASAIGGDLAVTVGGRTNTTAISTNGAVVIGGNASLISASSANSSISIANNSTIAGYVSAATAGGAVTINSAAALTLGNITTNLTATSLTGGAYTPLAVAGPVTLGAGGTVTGVTLTAGTVDPIYFGNVTGTFSSPIASVGAVVGVSTLTVTNGGSGYTAVPAVTFAAPPTGGTAPTATATLFNGVVTGITINTPGTGYTSIPSVTIAAAPAGGTRAAASTNSVEITGITGLAGGSNYAAAPVVTIVGGGGTGATATSAITGDVVSGITLGGTLTGYTSIPSIVIAPPVAGAAAAQGRAVRDTTTGLVTSFEVTNAGFGYGATLPTVTFPAVATDTNFSSGGITATSAGALTTTIAGLGAVKILGGTSGTMSSGLRSGAGIALTGTTIATNAPVFARAGSNSTTSFTATAGGITFGDVVSANRISANTAAAGGTITQLTTATPSGAAAATITSGSNATSGSTLNAGNGTISLDVAANSWSNNSPISITAGTAGLRTINNLTVTTVNVTGNASLIARPTSAGNRGVTLGTGTGIGEGGAITVGGVLSVTANSAGTITDNDYSIVRATGGLNLAVTAGTDALPTIGSGAITFDAAAFGTNAQLGQVNASTTGAVSIAESTTLNLGNVGTAASPVASLRATSIGGGIIDSGNIFVATSGNSTFVLSGNNTAVLDGATNVLPTVNLVGGGDSSITAVNSNVVLGNATSVAAGNVTVGTNTGFAVTLGSFDITGGLTVNSGSWIDVAGTANITGNLTLNATGNIPSAATLMGTGAGLPFSSTFTPTVSINNTTGAVTGVAGTNFPALSFATAPTVTLVGGSLPTTGATPGALTLSPGGSITDIAAPVGAAQGAGYVIAPNVVVSAPPAGGVAATVTAVLTGDKVTSFTIVNAGSGYAAGSPPTVTLVGGGAPTTAATVTANLNSAGEITGFTVPAGSGGGGVLPYSSTLPLRVDIGGATNTSITETTGVLRVTGTTSISSPGHAILWRANDFNNVVLNNSTGGAVVNDVNNLRISGNSGGAVIARAGANGNATVGTPVTNAPAQIANTWALTLGNLHVNSLVAASQNGGGGDSGTLTQLSGTKIHSETLSRFETTNANIVIGNNGNNFGRVELNVASTDGSRTVTLVEDGTIKLGNLASRGTTTLTSRFGGIWEDPTSDVVISQNGTLVANATNGSILLGNTTHTAGTTTANVVTFNGTAPNGQIAITSNNSTTLGTINANSLNVSVTGGNGNITQTNAVRVFGTSNFSASRNITLTNNANNFGRLFLASSNASRDIQITEGGTLNLGGVSMGFPGDTETAPASTGNFTATSVSGDIIDSGLGGLKLGGRIAATGVVSPTVVTVPPTLTTGPVNIIGTGVVTLNAVNGNILLDDPTTDFFTTGGVRVNAINVTLAPLGTSALYLGAATGTSNVTGNLTVTSATGNILNAGALEVGRDAFFQSGSGDILVTNVGNNFGTVKFAGKVVSITEAGHLTILTGSSATDVATFVTNGGDITIENRSGIVTLAKTGFFSASAGAITLPKLIQAGDTLTVTASGTKNLSALSISSDLGGKAPINLGAGTYLPPQP